MTFAWRLAGLAGLTGIGIIALSTYSTGIGQAPIVITSDTNAYCRQLLTRIEDFVRTNAVIPPIAARLAEDGRQRCRSGEIRQGILHLRQAVVIIQPEMPRH
jgi:hypothetical protein